MCCGEILGFSSGSDAWTTLLRVWWIPLPEVPPGYIYILRFSRPCWDLNHRHSRRKSCNMLVVSGLTAGFCLAARFRCSPFPLHLNRWRCLLKPCNEKFFNELRLIFRVLLRFRCMGRSAARLVDTPVRSALRAHLRSAVFQARLASEPVEMLAESVQ